MRRLILLPLFAFLVTFSTATFAADGLYKGIIFAEPDTAQRIPGALVELDDGQSVVSNDVGYFEFTVAPGTYTATASADGYETNSSTRTIGDGEEVWGSIGLTAGEVGDSDGDGISDSMDNCPDDYNPSQLDKDLDGIGDSCDPVDNTASSDDDGDTVANDVDNCPDDYNPGQGDKDLDGIGDACDPVDNTAAADSDEDGISDEQDNCPDTYNPDQTDSDLDGIGDPCDENDAPADVDKDGIADEQDNCPETYNPQQEDLDADGVGDACDESSIEPDVVTEEDLGSEEDIMSEDMVEIASQDDIMVRNPDVQEADSGSCDPVQCPAGECQCDETGGCSVTAHAGIPGDLWLLWGAFGVFWVAFRRRERENPSCSS